MSRHDLSELCTVLRTKNAGPFKFTIDVLFKDRGVYETVKEKNLISRETIATAYGVPIADVFVLETFDNVCAIKATLRRRLPSGSPGDPDCYAMNQEAPMLTIPLPQELFER